MERPKVFISQPMRGKSMHEIMAERKALIADAAVALQSDDIEVLDTLFSDQDAPPLALLGRAITQMAQADAVVFAPGWQDARGCRVERQVAAEYDIPIIDARG